MKAQTTLSADSPLLCTNQQIRYKRKVHSGEAMSKNAGINSSSENTLLS